MCSNTNDRTETTASAKKASLDGMRVAAHVRKRIASKALERFPHAYGLAIDLLVSARADGESPALFVELMKVVRSIELDLVDLAEQEVH